MTLDPGTCPAPTSDAELKSVSNDTSREGLILDQLIPDHRRPRFGGSLKWPDFLYPVHGKHESFFAGTYMY